MWDGIRSASSRLFTSLVSEKRSRAEFQIRIRKEKKYTRLQLKKRKGIDPWTLVKKMGEKESTKRGAVCVVWGKTSQEILSHFWKWARNKSCAVLVRKVLKNERKEEVVIDNCLITSYDSLWRNLLKGWKCGHTNLLWLVLSEWGGKKLLTKKKLNCDLQILKKDKKRKEHGWKRKSNK